MTDIQLKPARSEDLLAVAQVFTEAFPESLLHTWGRIPELAFTAEAFRVCLDAEPDAFYVARVSEGGVKDGGKDGVAHRDEVVGYAFTPAKLSRLWLTAVTHGHLGRWAWRAVTGRYRIGWHPLGVLFRNKWSFFRSALDRRFNVPARILSIAVRPAYQGQGIATALMRRGLAYLEAEGVPRVRLEVRPDNGPAVAVYTRLGFERVAETADSQGLWAIMIKEMR